MIQDLSSFCNAVDWKFVDGTGVDKVSENWLRLGSHADTDAPIEVFASRGEESIAGGSNFCDVEAFKLLFKTLGGGAQGFNVPSCATTAESQALLLLVPSILTGDFSFHIGLIEIVLPFPLSADKILKGHFVENEFELTVFEECDLPIKSVLLDKLKSDEKTVGQ